MTQETIDLAIASYLKTNDNTARQYLKLRQDALEFTQMIGHDIIETGSMRSESALKLDQLKYESTKSSSLYKAYLDNLMHVLKLDSGVGQTSSRLSERVSEISEKKKLKDESIDRLRKEHKPVVEKMSTLASNFENGISGRRIRGKQGMDGSVFTSKGSDPDEYSVLMDFSSTVFSKIELSAQLLDVESRLGSLTTVDEINEESDLSIAQEKGASIHLTKYLDELLQGGRAYQHLDDLRYHFDVTKSATPDMGGPSAVISDYEIEIESLTREIQGLVARGTEAKVRWMNNAQKIEMIQTLLQEDMDIDG